MTVLQRKIEENRSVLFSGMAGIRVELWDRLDAMTEARKVASFYHSTWGDLINPKKWREHEYQRDAQMVAEGRALPNCLESVSLTFGITGVSRATTHQLVRSRVGAVFGQQGGRDNNWSNFNFRVPDSFPGSFHDRLHDLRSELDLLYQQLLAEGVPTQDARYVLPMGLTTNLVAGYNLLSLKGTLARRLCNRMQWEINYVARLMHDLTVEALPWVGRSLRSSCEQRGICGSVSDMFPPACVGPDGERAKDNATLRQMIRHDGYTYPEEVNGTKYFTRLDESRMKHESADDSIVMSLVNGRILATRGVDGLWRAP